MIVEKTSLDGVLVVQPSVFRDERGFFLEWFNKRVLAGTTVGADFVQDNHSRSTHGVIRGLHYQLRHPQGKLVRVVRGRILDVAVDIRRGSPSFGRWHAQELDDENLTSMWIPEGFAHGYCVLSDVADVVYKCTAFYDPLDTYGVAWNDSALAIPWPVSNVTVSPKDASNRSLADMLDELPVFR